MKEFILLLSLACVMLTVVFLFVFTAPNHNESSVLIEGYFAVNLIDTSFPSNRNRSIASYLNESHLRIA